jgi:hypothetical protein
MSVEDLRVVRSEPYEGGVAFGSAGPYERVDALVRFAVDPALPANAGVIDLERAPRGTDGRVRFDADLVLLRPVEPDRGNGTLFVSVVNRGRRAVVPFSGPPPLELSLRTEPGDGFLLRRGYTVAFCGWQWDVERRPELVGLRAPLAEGVEPRVTVQFQPNAKRLRERLAHYPWHPAPENQQLSHTPYPVADLLDREATLSVRDGLHAPPRAIPRANWRFVDPEHVELDGGFEAGRIYGVTYRSAHAPVVGAGLIAIRDAVAHLRRERGIRHVIGWGVSQTGRFLRELLHGGFDADERGTPVFDGLFIQVAGARRGEFNARGAQPSAQYAPGPWHEPPFAHEDLLRAQRTRGGVPRIFEVNSANEYWRSESSLVHTDEKGVRDVEAPAEVRIYALASTQHVPGFPVLIDSPPLLPEVRAANPIGTLNPGPLLRAALVNLEQWIADGREPPPSVHPRLGDGSARTRSELLTRLAALPGLALPEAALLPRPDSTCVASELDADLNELAGVRHPEVTVPLATHTGWNPRHASIGAKGELVDMLGTTLPFAQSADERARRNDPRPSIEERYRDRDDYLARVRRAAEALVADRWLLAEDVDGLIRGAGRLYDLLTRERDPG